MIDDTVLLRYLDNELDEQTAATVVEQLRRDPALQRRAAELRAVEAAYCTVFDQDHDLPYKPRLALLERLRREPPASRYDLIDRADLEALAQVRSAEPLIFSLYLNLRPDRRKDEPPPTRFKNMLRHVKQQIRVDQRSHAYREHWAEETEHLRAWLNDERPFEGHGLMLLSCQLIGLWRAFRIAEERVRLLVVEEEFAPAGWECPNCRFITATEQERCPVCGTALDPHPDVVELALERVLDRDGDIEVLRSPESRQALAKYGQIGALLRYAYTAPVSENGDV